MSNEDLFIQLRDLLAELYLTEDDALRVLADSGIDARRVRLGTTAINSWHSILREAIAGDMVDDLLALVAREYPGNAALRAFQAQYGMLVDSGESFEAPSTLNERRSQFGLFLMMGGLALVALAVVLSWNVLRPNQQAMPASPGLAQAEAEKAQIAQDELNDSLDHMKAVFRFAFFVCVRESPLPLSLQPVKGELTVPTPGELPSVLSTSEQGETTVLPPFITTFGDATDPMAIECLKEFSLLPRRGLAPYIGMPLSSPGDSRSLDAIIAEEWGRALVDMKDTSTRYSTVLDERTLSLSSEISKDPFSQYLRDLPELIDRIRRLEDSDTIPFPLIGNYYSADSSEASFASLVALLLELSEHLSDQE